MSPLLRHVWPYPLTSLIPHLLTGTSTPAFCIRAWKRSYCAIDFISTVPVWQCALAIYLLCLPEDQLSGLAMFIVCGVLRPEYGSIACMLSEIGHDIFLSLQTCLLPSPQKLDTVGLPWFQKSNLFHRCRINFYQTRTCISLLLAFTMPLATSVTVRVIAQKITDTAHIKPQWAKRFEVGMYTF